MIAQKRWKPEGVSTGLRVEGQILICRGDAKLTYLGVSGGAERPRSLIVRGGVYAAGGAIFAAGSLPTRAKIVSLQICRPEIACDAQLVL